MIRLVGIRVAASYPNTISSSVYYQQGKEKVKASLSQKPWEKILLCLIGYDWDTSVSHHLGQSNTVH